MPQTFQCPNCNAPPDYDGGSDLTIQCPYCNSSVIVPESLRAGQPDAGNAFADPFTPAALSQLGEIGRLARDGNKIEAIKLYRQVFGVGLKEAKDAVEAMERGEAVNLPPIVHVERKIEAHPALVEAEIRQLMAENQKIEAIKRYREVYGSGLKESKEAVETLQRTGVLPLPVGAPSPANDERSAALAKVAHLAQNGQRDEAIALYRQTMDSSQQEAEGVVQMLATTGDMLPGWVVTQIQHRLAAERPRPKISPQKIRGLGCTGVLGLLFILLVTVGPILAAMSQRGGPLAGVWARVNPFAFARLTQSFGGEGIGAGLFSDPRALTVDGEGRIFVGDYTDGRIQRFGADGRFQALIAIPTDAYVSGLAVSREGVLYAVYRGEIWQFDAENGAALGALPNPLDFYYDSVAVTPDDGLLAAEDGNLLRLSAGGDVIWLAEGAVSNVLGGVSSVSLAVDGLGNIFVLDETNDALLKFSPEGQYLDQWAGPGDEPGQIDSALAIAVDGYGRVFVSNWGEVEVFAADGRYLTRFDIPAGVAFGLTFNVRNELIAVSSEFQVYTFQTKKP